MNWSVLFFWQLTKATEILNDRNWRSFSRGNKMQAERLVQDEVDREALHIWNNFFFICTNTLSFTLNEICVPTNDDVRFYPNKEDWSWDAKTKTMAIGLRHSMISFEHIFSFVCAKEMMEPMRPHVTALQGRLVEVYFGFQKIEEIIKCFSKEKRAHYELCALIPQVITSMSEETTTWGHLMPLPSSFESEVFRWMNHLGLLTIRKRRRRHLFSKREGTSKNFRRLPYGEQGGGKVIFLYSDDPYLASQHNDHRMSHRFSRHRYACNVVTIDRSVVCEKFVALHPRRMTASTSLAD